MQHITRISGDGKSALDIGMHDLYPLGLEQIIKSKHASAPGIDPRLRQKSACCQKKSYQKIVYLFSHLPAFSV